VNSWNILTAAPSAGKSSVLRELSSRGYRTCPESATIVLDQHISDGGDVSSFRDKEKFNDKIVEKDIQTIKNAPQDEVVFFDRSIFDNIVYRQMSGLETPDVEEYVPLFENIFIFERLPIESDYRRTEDDEEAEEIQKRLVETYEKLGFNPQFVELDTVVNRADYIEELAVYGPPVIH
jgi:predicted ATPase